MTLGIMSLVDPAIDSTAAAAEPPQQIEGGLVRVAKGKLDHVYVLPGANFANYTKLRIDPVDVSFSPNWNPNESERSPSRRLTSSDIERIRTTVAEEFHRVFERELSGNGYSIVQEDGPDVLRVTPRIINLYINAPDRPSAGRSRTYVSSTGHMSLDIALRDSTTGEYLARAVDNVTGDTAGARWQVANTVTNLATARTAFSRWARALRQGLEDAKEAAPEAGSPSKVAEGQSASPR